jgi:small subunit ribosomal protein S15
MARRFSRRKGKARSHKPLKKALPTWINHPPKEIELLIVKLSKEEKTPSQIGLVLRDSYGVPDVKRIVGKSITKILKEKGISPKLPEDIVSLIKRVIKLKKHIEMNHNDEKSKRGLKLTEAKIFALEKYYKRTNKLPKEWAYSADQAGMLLR